jgi:hypothetical protein
MEPLLIMLLLNVYQNVQISPLNFTEILIPRHALQDALSISMETQITTYVLFQQAAQADSLQIILLECVYHFVHQIQARLVSQFLDYVFKSVLKVHLLIVLQDFALLLVILHGIFIVIILPKLV